MWLRKQYMFYRRFSSQCGISTWHFTLKIIHSSKETVIDSDGAGQIHQQESRTDLISFHGITWFKKNDMREGERVEECRQQYVQCFFMHVSGSCIAYTVCVVYVFWGGRKKTIGRQWRTSETRGWKNEVRQEFLENDGQQNKSNVTASIPALCCISAARWHCS